MACERLVHQANGTHHAVNLYLDPLPWRPPATHLPIAAVFLLEGVEEGQREFGVAVRLLSSRGIAVAEISSKVPGQPRDGSMSFPGFLEGHLSIDEPGDYELLAIAEGQPVDDAPVWRLRFQK